MSLFPKIQSPCPYVGELDQIMAGSHCTKCDHDVIDLTAMSDGERQALVAGCADELCVSYRLPIREALTAAAMSAAFGMAAPAFAADVDGTVEPQTTDLTTTETADAADAEAYSEDMMIIVGGLKEPKRTVWVKAKDDKRPANMAELPVVYDDEDAPHNAAAADAPAKPTDAKPARGTSPAS